MLGLGFFVLVGKKNIKGGGRSGVLFGNTQGVEK